MCVITCLLAAGRGTALSPGSISEPVVLDIHTAQRATLTGNNTKREGCAAVDFQPPSDLRDKQGDETERRNAINARNGKRRRFAIESEKATREGGENERK